MDLNLLKQIRVLGNSINLLYVEDDPFLRRQIATTLKKMFTDIDVAHNGVEAFTMYNEKNYDLVLTDIVMPEMDGIELCTKIIGKNPEQSIFIISAYKEEDQLLKLIDLGAAGFISKPVNLNKLLQKLYVKVKKIYAAKMMQYHYQQLKTQLNEDMNCESKFNSKDSLTSAYTQKHLQQLLHNTKEIKSAILINIDDFKLINDFYSYAHGNHLLFQFAVFINNTQISHKFDIFRLSGDEFVLLYKVDTSTQELLEDANFLNQNIVQNRFNLIGIQDINISVTMGLARDSERILEQLSIALHNAREQHKTVSFYNENSNNNAKMYNILKTKKILQESIENNLIVPVFQPIKTVGNGFKYEVLMRIQQQGKTLLEPASFLSVAKEYNYYNQISQMLVFKAIEAISHKTETFSINISYQDIKHEEFMNQLEEIIIKNKIGQRLIFEIVESDIIEDIKVLEQFLTRFKAHGVKVAIDDFGSGYSNFSYILQIDPNYIKLDGCLIKNILEDSKTFTLVQTIIEFAHKLQIEVIAEHVSSKELYDVLLDLNVDAMQGYYIGYPASNAKSA